MSTMVKSITAKTGVPVLIDYGIRAAAATGDPRISITLMSASNIDVATAGASDAPMMTVTMSPVLGNALSYTTKP